MRFISRLLICFALAASAWAQSVHWEPPTATLSLDQTSELQLVFDDCEPKDDPAVPAVPGLSLQSVGQSSNMSIINGHVSQSVVVTYHVRVSRRIAVTIPTFTVNTSKGKISVPAATYQVADATVGQGNVALDAVATSFFDLPHEVWAGEVFNFGYTMNVARRYFNSLGSNQPDWNPAPLAVEEWSKPTLLESEIGGERRGIISYKSRASIKEPGEVTLNPATQLVDLTTGTQSFGFFARPNVEQFTITTSPAHVNVRPLPGGAPASFSGAVGQFQLESKVVPTSGAVGEPITWTLTLTGTGNWPDIHGLPTRDVSRDFHVVQPQARRTPKAGALFDATLTEDVVLIPTQPGKYQLGPITWSYFDPAKGSYETVTTKSVQVVVSPPTIQPIAPPPASAQTQSGTANASENAASFSGRAPIAAHGAPAAIPRDPIPGSEIAPLPWRTHDFVLALLTSFPLLLLGWIGLACRRARLTDPNRPQREAAARLHIILGDLRSAKSTGAVHRLLQSWQRETALLWRVSPIVPRPKDFVASAPSALNSIQVWSDLWSEAERVLYRPDESLSTDWIKKAEAALNARTLPRFSPLQLFHRRNLLPFAALLVIAATLPHLHALNAEAENDYRESKFSEAEAGWRKQVDAAGNDWIARHNLSLSLAQQNRWSESSAQAVAAFVQNPSDSRVRWNLAFEIDRAGFEPGLMTGFLANSPLHTLARQLSPAEWQRAMVVIAWIGALGLMLVLLRYYLPLGRWAARTGLAIFAASSLALLLGSLAITQYEEAADVRSALIWKPGVLRSIPTEADATQKTSPLAPGTVAIIDKTFLGWARLSFDNGQTGWVRQEELVKLWK